jgi:hypothetical protein
MHVARGLAGVTFQITVHRTTKSMKRDRRAPEDSGFEQYQDDINWTAGVGRPAGIFWLGGRCVMAAHETPAESRLLELGAVLIGTLRFDADPLETVHRTGRVERIAAARASRDYLLSGSN